AAASPSAAPAGQRTGAIAPARLHRIEQGLRRTVGGCRSLKHCASNAGCSQPDPTIGVLECAVTTTSDLPDPDGNGTTKADGSFMDVYGAEMTVVFVRVLIGRDGGVTLRR